MNFKIILARIVGAFYLFIGMADILFFVFNFDGAFDLSDWPRIIIPNLGCVAVGIGLLTLRQWSISVWGALVLAKFLINFQTSIDQVIEYITYYTYESAGYLIYHFGFTAITMLIFYFIWPALEPDRLSSTDMLVLVFVFFWGYNKEIKQEWMGFVYLDKNDLWNDRNIGIFDSLEACRSEAKDILYQKGVAFTGDYECGLNCDTSKGKPYICEENKR